MGGSLEDQAGGRGAGKGCKRCGECCNNGGPALHSQDLALITSGKIPISELITIRKGELAHNPLSGKIQPASVELVKIIGTGREWRCRFYDMEQGCTIYSYRPVGCRLLKCWDTTDILALVEKDTLSRLDIIPANDPLAALVEEHETLCPCGDLQAVQASRGSLDSLQKDALERRVRSDLQFRRRVVKDLGLSLREELFYFGRPYFQLLQPFGLRIAESKTGISLTWSC